MKTKLFLTAILLCLFTQLSHAQDPNKRVGKIYKFLAPVPVVSEEVFSAKANLSNKVAYLETGYKFRLMEEDATHVKVMALDFKPRDNDSKKSEAAKLKSDQYNGIVYKITLQNFNIFSKEIEESDILSIGLLTLPFKARPQGDFTFDTEFNLNSTLNIRLGNVYGASFNYQIGAGIGSVGLNTSNASKLTEDEAQDVAVLTLLNGFMIQYKRVQAGLYAGVDQINNQRNYDWESNGNLWVGFGIGYNLFDLSVGEPSQQQNNP